MTIHEKEVELRKLIEGTGITLEAINNYSMLTDNDLQAELESAYVSAACDILELEVTDPKVYSVLAGDCELNNSVFWTELSPDMAYMLIGRAACLSS